MVSILIYVFTTAILTIVGSSWRATAQHAGLSTLEEIHLHGIAQVIIALQPLWCSSNATAKTVKDQLDDRNDATRTPGLLELSHVHDFNGQFYV